MLNKDLSSLCEAQWLSQVQERTTLALKTAIEFERVLILSADNNRTTSWTSMFTNTSELY